MKIFTITHKEFNPPEDKLYVPLHVGHIKYSDGTLPEGSEDFGYLGDDTGDNISSKNNLYSELTGLYWVWKNCKDLDYAGLVHYRRFFANRSGQRLGEKDFAQLLELYDVIISEHITYDVTYREKFAQYHHIEDLDKTGAVIKEIYPKYYDTFLEVINSNEQYLFNMFVAPKKLWDEYSEWLFNICFELEKVIDVSGYDNYRARIYGFLAEELLYVWIKHNKLRYYEAPVIYTQEKAETIEFKRELKRRIEEEGYLNAYDYFQKVFKERPDLTLDDSDFTQELRILLILLTYAKEYPQECVDNTHYRRLFEQLRHADRSISDICDDFEREGEAKSCRLDAFADNGITENMITTVIDISRNYWSFKDRLVHFLKGESESYADNMNSILINKMRTVALIHYNTDVSDAEVMEKVTAYYQSGLKGECILIDAVGNQELYERIDEKFNQTLIYNVSDSEFDTVAQLKNLAVEFAQNEQVICIVTDLQCEDLSDVLVKLVCKPKIQPQYEFDELILKNDDEISLMQVDKEMFSTTGAFNAELPGAEDYELLVRACAMGKTEGFKYVCDSRIVKSVFQENFVTYAYVMGKYSVRLRDKGLFDSVFSLKYQSAKSFGVDVFFVQQLKQMISNGPEFTFIDMQTRPVLVLTGENICYGVLDEFAQQFADAIRKTGQNVVLFNVRNDNVDDIRGFYRAVVGFQTSFFVNKTSDGELKEIGAIGPKMQFVFDHPLFISYYLMLPVRNNYILSQDDSYATYVNKYFQNVQYAYHFPPAGTIGEYGEDADYKYDLSFIGTFNNYRERFAAIRELNGQDKRLALKLINKLKHNPNMTAEAAMNDLLDSEGIRLSKKEFIVRLHCMYEAVRIIIFYYREKVLKTILDAGIRIDVFSESWKKSPLAKYDNLVVHNNVSYKQGLRVMRESRISLNIMSWHKGGMTERVANAMLNYSVCLTDKTDYIVKNFSDGQDILLFDLEKLYELPGKIKTALADKDKLADITRKSYEKASAEHTWDARAMRFMELLDDIEFDINNYESYYVRAIKLENDGEAEAAYYNYKLAMFLARGTEDEDIIKDKFDELCSYAGVNAYKMGKSLEKLVIERMRKSEYELTSGFLNEQLYDTNKIAAKMVLSEPNMLLSMMLEIVLCEKNRFSKAEFEKNNTAVKYSYDVNEFNKIYKKVKLMARRVWFGLNTQEQMEINRVLSENDISSDMFAVILKYSVRQEFWLDEFNRVIALISDKHPDMAVDITQYRDFIASMKLQNQQSCREPAEFDNGVDTVSFDCAAGKFSREPEDADVAIIFCTNDKEYEAECISYLRKLEIPNGVSAQVVSVWNGHSMAGAYNMVMERLTAKYKIYIHHDTFIIQRNIIGELLKGFEDKDTGLIGVVASLTLPDNGFWWKNDDHTGFRMNMYQECVLNILKSQSVVTNGMFEDVEAVDGVLIATDNDIRWRDDLFAHWHFYDISQCYEFRKNGMKTKIYNSDELTMLHEMTMKKDPMLNYERYCEIFRHEYMGFD